VTPVRGEGAAFGTGTSRDASARDPRREAGMQQVAAGAPDWQRARRARMRVEEGLVRLEELGMRRVGARDAVRALTNEIEAAVEHLRVDGATWVQIGRALGISRQGARQVFGTVGATHTTRADLGDPQTFER